MRKIKLLVTLIIVISQAAFAQIPHLKGEIKVSILNGTIEDDLEYSNLPTYNLSEKAKENIVKLLSN